MGCAPTTIKTDSLSKGIGLMAAANILQRGIGFIRNIAFCYFLSQSDVGLWALASSFFIIAAPLVVLGLPGSFGRYVDMYRQRGQLRAFIWKTCSWSIGGLTLFAAICLLYPQFTSQIIFGQELTLASIAIVILTLVTVVVFNALMELLNGLKQPTAVSSMQLVSSIAFSLIALPAVILWKHWTVVLACYALSMSLGTIPGIIRLWKRCQPAFQDTQATSTREMMTRVIPFAISVWAVDLLSNLFDVVDRYMLLHLASNDQTLNQSLVGQFHTARILPVLFLSIAAMISGMLLPYWSSDWEADKKASTCKSINASIKASVYFFWFASLAAMCVSPLLFGAIFKGTYPISEACFPAALCHCVFASVVLLQTSALRCVEANRSAIGVLALAFITNTALSYLLVPRMGVLGAMWATLAATLIMLLMNAWLMFRRQIKADLGLWLSFMVPMTLLMPIEFAFASAVVIVFVAGRTNWLLTEIDRADLDHALLPLVQRFGLRFRSLWPAKNLGVSRNAV
jgi:polysaccharide transporter, PST family